MEAMHLTLTQRCFLRTSVDAQDKIVEAASISSLGAAQLQWQELLANGMDFLNMPAQVTFGPRHGSALCSCAQYKKVNQRAAAQCFRNCCAAATARSLWVAVCNRSVSLTTRRKSCMMSLQATLMLAW